MTLACEILGWVAVIGGLLTIKDAGLGIGTAGAILLGFAYAGAFNGF